MDKLNILNQSSDCRLIKLELFDFWLAWIIVVDTSILLFLFSERIVGGRTQTCRHFIHLALLFSCHPSAQVQWAAWSGGDLRKDGRSTQTGSGQAVVAHVLPGWFLPQKRRELWSLSCTTGSWYCSMKRLTDSVRKSSDCVMSRNERTLSRKPTCWRWASSSTCSLFWMSWKTWSQVLRTIILPIEGNRLFCSVQKTISSIQDENCNLSFSERRSFSSLKIHKPFKNRKTYPCFWRRRIASGALWKRT